VKRPDLFLIVDGLNLFTRHFVAHPAVGENGNHVGGVVGFLYNLIHLIEDFKPSQVYVVWEGGGASRKRSIYSDYKKKRKPEKLNRFYEDDIPNTVENRNDQISLLVDLIKNMPICQIYVPDCEADDVIGYLSKYKLSGNRKLIASSDRDYYQLLDKETIIYSPTWKKLVTSKEVKSKFLISANNFCLAKAICGDPSDNIPGVKGVGFKVLAKRYPMLSSSLDIDISEVMSHSQKMIDDGSKIKAYGSILNSEDMILRNWKLIYLDTSNLTPFQISALVNIVDTFTPIRNKMAVMKTLLKAGIKTFNVDRLFSCLSIVGR